MIAYGGGGGAAQAGGPGGGGEAVDESEMKKGPWTAAEDAILMEYVKRHGEGNWNSVQKNSGLSRCGKSCRLRWANHLRPNLKKGAFSPDEERLILQLHAKLGNKWARMAAQLPGRTDNEIKNYWNTRIKRRQRQGLPLYPPDIQRQQAAMHAHRPPAPLPLSSLHLLDPAAAGAPHLAAFHAHSFLHDGGYINSAGHHHFLAPPTSSTLPAVNQSLFPFSGHGQTHPFFHPGIHFGAAGTADPNSPVDDLSIKLELPSSQIPDSGPSFIYGRPVADLDDFLLDSGGRENGERSSTSLVDTQHHDKPSFVGWAGATSTPPFMSVNPSSSNSANWRSGGGGHGDSDHPIPPAEIPTREEEELTTLFSIMPGGTGVGEWRSDSGEASNSALTDDDVSLEMKQLGSSETDAGRASLEASGAGDKDWGIISSCSWNNMPNIS